jgi:hypothetical protein
LSRGSVAPLLLTLLLLLLLLPLPLLLLPAPRSSRRCGMPRGSWSPGQRVVQCVL